MKKLLHAVIAATVMLCACTKEEIVTNHDGIYTLHPNESQNLSLPSSMLKQVEYEVKDGRLILDNSDEFELLIHVLETHELDDWQNEIHFNSYRTSHHLDEKIDEHDYLSTPDDFIFDDLVLASVLNPQGIIQINPYLIKLDPLRQKVYVIPAQETSLYKQLEQAIHATDKIMEFSFDEDVWGILEDRNKDSLAQLDANQPKKCNELKSNNKQVFSSAIECTCTLYYWEQVFIYVWYNKFGIWETVKSQFVNHRFDMYAMSNGMFRDANLMDGFVLYEFDEYCGIQYEGIYNLPRGPESNRIYLIRSSKKPLERYKSRVTMQTTFQYIVIPSESQQTLSTTLNYF